MIDPELQRQLENINTHLGEIKGKKSPGIFRAFFNGVFSALGYVVGLAMVIVVLGWVLNKLGLLPAFKEQVKQFQSLMGSAQRLINGADNTQQQGSATSTQNGYMITLPDGRKAEIVPQ